MNYCFFVTLVMTLIASSCVPTTRYISNVSSFADASYSGGKTYYLAPGMKGVADSDLEFREYASHVEVALANKGYTRTDDPIKADLLVFMAYAISDPKHIPYSYTSPVFGVTGGDTVNFDFTSRGSQGAVRTTGVAKTPQSFGVTGYQTESGVSTEYTRSLAIDAYSVDSIKNQKQLAQVWKITVVSTGSNSDLRLVLPMMVKAAEEYVGVSGKGVVEIDVNGQKKTVQK